MNNLTRRLQGVRNIDLAKCEKAFGRAGLIHDRHDAKDFIPAGASDEEIALIVSVVNADTHCCIRHSAADEVYNVYDAFNVIRRAFKIWGSNPLKKDTTLKNWFAKEYWKPIKQYAESLEQAGCCKKESE